MRVTRIGPAHYRSMPWKNGLGATTEIARAPQEGELDWRVSIAQVVSDGPFSTFPGCDRVILILEGSGMVLTHHEVETEVVVGPLEPWSFSGDWTTTCVLREEPIRDFNVITRRGAFTAAVSVMLIHVPRTIELTANITLFYCVQGSLLFETATPAALEREQTLILERSSIDASDVVIRPSHGPAIVVQVQLFRSPVARGN